MEEDDKKFNFFEQDLNKFVEKGKIITVREISKIKFLDDNYECRVNFNNIGKNFIYYSYIMVFRQK